MQRLQPVLAALWRGIVRTWQRGLWGKIAVAVGAFVLSCCGLALIGAALPQPRTAVAPTSAPAVAAEPTTAPEPTRAPAPEPTRAPTVAPSATPVPPTTEPTQPPTAEPTQAPTAIPATPTAARELGVMVKADLGDKWPLTVGAIRLRCLPGYVLVFDAEGTTYALNGTAKSKRLYADIRPIWLDDPNYADIGLKISLDPLFDVGLPLCS